MKLLVQTGKVGDLINLLPLAYDSKDRIGIVTCEPYAGVIDGCSYVEKIVAPCQPHEIDKAVAHAKTLSNDVVCTQVVGPPDLVRKYTYEPAKQDRAVTESFQKEAWHIAGRLGDWRKNIPLVFDRRNKEREQALVDKYVGKKKLMLVALGGKSSPFHDADLLTELLTLKFNRQYDVLDISSIQCERIYDLLGLYEKATVIVASDSAPLHLARATTTPTVALVNDMPSLWHGSVWRSHHIAHVRYGDFQSRFRDILESISRLGKAGCWTGAVHGVAKAVHCWSGYELTEESKVRHAQAKESWQVVYEAGAIACQVELGAIGRDSRTHFKEEPRFPFVKDVLRLACQRAGNDDDIILTRHDSILLTSASQRVRYPHYCRRTIAGKLQTHIDYFAFKKSWWLEHQIEYPDMVMGRDVMWGKILAELIKLHGGKEARGLCCSDAGAIIPLAKQPAYYGYNQHHAQEFMAKFGLIHKSKPVSAQAQTTIVNSPILPRFGYNPSLLRWRNRLLMAFRHHHAGTLSTRLAMVELNDQLQVQKWSAIRLNEEVAAHSYEDPRLFIFRDQPWLAYVESKYPKSLSCVMRYAELFEDSRGWRTATPYQPRYGKNDWSGTEKNWVPFEADGKLHFIYATEATEQTVLEVDADYCTEIRSSHEDAWERGVIRGGAMIRRGEQFVRYFHSRTNDEMPPHPWRYYVGSLVMDAKPPFGIIKVNQKPLLEGSEEGGYPDCHHYKAKVVFPAGAVGIDGGALVSVGVNDSSCEIVRLI